MAMISKTIDHRILPVPSIFPITGERAHQLSTGLGRQVTSLVPGVVASTLYPGVSHQAKLLFVRKMALAFQACWRIPLPGPQMIGELIANESDGHTSLTIGPDRHHGLGGPFSSVRDYLKAYISSWLVALERQQGVEDYKDKYPQKIRDFVNTTLHKIPDKVENVPIVPMHSDMGLHNIIVSSDDCTDIKAIIDWEFVAASAPFASLDRTFEMFFRNTASNGCGLEYVHADELREAFWDSMPDWKLYMQKNSPQVFRIWFRFGRFMKPQWKPPGLTERESQEFWRHNI